jgi:uncharacterized repeat protein (TIGR01451 family)
MNIQSRARFLPGNRAPIILGLLLIVEIWPGSGLKQGRLLTSVLAADKVKTILAPAVLYSNDFSGPVGPEWSNTSTATAPCGKSFLGQFGSGTVSLSLDNLPAHTELTVVFDLFIINAWGGSLSNPVDGVPQGPDIWDLSVAGGPTLLHTTFSNNGDAQAYPGTFPGASNPAQSGASEVSTLGYTFDYGAEDGGVAPSDAVYHLAFTVDNTSSSVQLNFSADLSPAGASLADKGWGLANFALGGTVDTTKPALANLSIDTAVTPHDAASGTTLTYTTTVKNRGPMPATGVKVEEELNQSATFISASASQGTVLAPQVGCPFSRIVVELGSIPKDGTATITTTVEILSVAGLSVLNTATVNSETPDDADRNNSIAINAKLTAGAVALISWQQATSTGGDETPAPQSPQIGPGAANPIYSSFGGFVPGPANNGSCQLIKVNIYKSGQSAAEVSPTNLVGTAAAALLQANVPFAPGGSSYVLTNVWNCGGTLIESAPSSPVSLPAGPKITLAKILKSGKLKIIGNGFAHGIKVFADGVGFSLPAALGGSTKVVQKGTLTNGTSAFDLLDAGQPLVVTVQNPDGGIASIIVER